MKIKLAMLMFIIPVFFAFHSCLDYSLPEQIQVEAEGSINLPVRIRTSNWGAILAKVLEKAFPSNLEDKMEIGVEIYNVNYGQDVQAFCVSIPVKISNSLNPYDYLDDIDLTKLGKKESLKIEESVDIPSFKDFPINCQIDYPFPLPLPSNVETFTISSPIVIPVISPDEGIPLGASIGDYFLHALVGEGPFDINLDLSEGDIVPADGEFTKEYAITISQEADTSSLGSSSSEPYYGLAYSDFSDQSLKNQNINRNNIKIGGTVTLRPKAGGGTVTIKNPEGDNKLAGQLNITMDIKEFTEIDINWNATNISDVLKNPDPVSLADVAKYLNWIEFEKCDDDTGKEPTKGIGINMYFDKIFSGLKLGIVCSELPFTEAKPLEKGNNVFGNTEDLTDPRHLKLTGNGAVKELNFTITLSPDSDGNVLKLRNMKTGKAWITGEANFFAHWKKAEVNMLEALKLSSNNGVFKGQFPNEKDDPIDLSLLDEYIDGFKIMEADILAAAYLSGPDKTINDESLFEDLSLLPSLLITAEYTDPSLPNTSPNTLLTVIKKDQSNDRLMLEKKHVILEDLKDNREYFDVHGSYKYKVPNGNEKISLPPDGNSFKFLDIINTRPKNLVFHYEVTLPDTIEVTQDMFFDEKTKEPVPHDILANIILLMHMKLTAGDKVELTNGKKGGVIKYPGLFDDNPNDLFGREADKNDPTKPEKDSMFTSLNVGYIRLAVDFAGPFFNGGNLFIEKYEKDRDGNVIYKPILFPDGNSVGGRRVDLNINDKKFNIIMDNFIKPDFRLEFESGKSVTIPRNMGLTSVKIEAKGKTSVKLDF